MSPAGRPEIGTPINVRLGDALLAAVDVRADLLGMSRAELIRMLVSDGLHSFYDCGCGRMAMQGVSDGWEHDGDDWVCPACVAARVTIPATP